MGEIYDNIDEYLKGSLQGTQLAEFESKLRLDKEFAEEVRQRYIIIQAIKEARKAELKQFIRDRVSPTELNNRKLTVRRNLNMYYVAAAASIMVVASVIYLLVRDPKPEQVANKPDSHMPVDTAQVRDTLPVLVDKQDHLAQEKVFKKMPGKLRLESPVIRDQDTLIARADKDARPEELDQSYAGNKFEDAVVKRDVLLKDTTHLARLVTDLDPVYNDTPKTAEQNRKESEPVKKKVYPRSYDRNANTSNDISERYIYQVEFWSSPINFKGYLVNGKLIRLYGVDSGSVQLLSYKDKLYLAWGQDYYRLEADGKYHEYVKETDPAILNALKKN